MQTKVGVKEFRQNLPSYLESVLPVAITRHGETLGYYIPVRYDQNQADFQTLKKAIEKLQSMMNDLKVSEDEIVDEFKTLRAEAKVNKKK
jgi:PHD/YefM family antitoxin component YafN of YafNO toxin-antitoxin module